MRRILLSLLLIAAISPAATFTDDFTGAASPLWGNQSGAWYVHSDVYDASSGTPYPNARTLLPWVLTDFTVTVDTTSIGDGGIWLRATDDPGTSVGATGVLFVFRQNDMYFHDVTDGSGYGASLAGASHVSGAYMLTVNVAGDQYSVHAVSGSNIYDVVYTNSNYASGRVGLYDYIPLGFDNFGLDGREVPGGGEVPEPSTFLLLAAPLLLILRRR